MGLSAPMAVELVDDISELGLRMGFCFLWAGFGSLIGGPVNGALLTSKFIWWRPAVFSGVCVSNAVSLHYQITDLSCYRS